MTKRNWIIILLSILLFLSAAVLGVSSVYRVDEVTLYAPVISDEAEEEAAALKTRLLETYKKRSTLFAGREEADAVAEEFPYLRIVSFKKSYPNRLVLEVREDAEVYAVPTSETQEEYYILNADGVLLGVRKDSANRSTGGHNVILNGAHALNIVAEKGKVLTGDETFQALLAFVKQAHESLDGIQRNVLSVEVLRPAAATKETIFKVQTEEGVLLYVRNPLERTGEKAAKAMEEYLKLGDDEKTSGALLVYDEEETISVYYTTEDIPLL